MNPFRAYRKSEPSTGWSRVDLLLALYDGALIRLEKAEAAIRAGDPLSALAPLSKAQLIVTELAAGVTLEENEEVGGNLLRLYEYITHNLRKPELEGIGKARSVLVILREGFEAVRAEATDLERTGKLRSADRLQLVALTA